MLEEQVALHLGKMTVKELAKWFGVTESYMSKNKKSKIEKELGTFAEYRLVYGGVEIIKIKEPYYDKQFMKNKGIIFQHFDENWNENGLDTCKNVADKIFYKYGNQLTIKDTTTYNYVIDARNEYYGKPFKDLGKFGKCQYVWCKEDIIGDDGIVVYTPLTEDELAIKEKMMKQYFGSNEEKDIMIAEMVHQGEISKEEAYDLMTEYRGLNKKGFGSFMKALGEAIGATVVKGTLIERNIPVGDVEGTFLEEGK